MKVKTYRLIERLVDEGIQGGWNRAHKHTETPSPDSIKYAISEYIMLCFDEAFEFDQEE